MTPDALNTNDSSWTDLGHDLETEPVEAPASFEHMSTPELELMQNITLNEMKETRPGVTQILLGRVWYRLEQERRRRAAEVATLEKMYFAR